MKPYLGIVLLCFGGCLFGCAQNARQLAGFSNPSVIVKKSIFGFTAQIGTNFTGEAILNKDGTYTIKVNSSPEGVIAAEAERADHLVALREIERMRIIQTHEAVGKNITAVVDLITTAALTGGVELARTVANAAIPILQGSSIALEGIGQANLGRSEPDPGGGDVS